MKCAKIQDEFSSYLENELDGQSSAEFERHIAECPQCKAAYNKFSAAVMILEEMPEVEPPADFHASVMARVEQARRATPRRVEWWRIDWQHVFTIRVPARAAAFGMAVLLLMVMLVKLTPGGLSGVASILGLQKYVSQSIIGTDYETAPPHNLSGLGVRSADDTPLMISVAPKLENGEMVYSLKFTTKSNKDVMFLLEVNGETRRGSVVQDAKWIMDVPVSNSDKLIAVRVMWNVDNVKQNEYIFLPAEFNASNSSKRLDIKAGNVTVKDLLSDISQKYGVVIFASGDLQDKEEFVAVEAANPETALDSTVVASSGMRQ